MAMSRLGRLVTALAALGLASALGVPRAFPAEGIESLRSRDAFDASAYAPLPVPEVRDSLPVEETPEGPRPKLRRDLNVFFIDVGQGDAQYIELPNGKNVLIDGGPSNGKVLEFLLKRGVKKIDHLVLTHPHADHYGGLAEVFEKLQVDNFYDTRIENPGASGDDVLRGLAGKEPGCKTLYPAPGDRLSWDPSVETKVFHGCPQPTPLPEDPKKISAAINNCSIVLKLSQGENSVLFAGDAQGEVEDAMVARYGSELSATVLKVPHHASRYSSTTAFLAAVSPRYAVIPVGAGNDYGFPKQEVLDRLAEAGAKVLRTDMDGTVDGSTLWERSGADWAIGFVSAPSSPAGPAGTVLAPAG